MPVFICGMEIVNQEAPAFSQCTGASGALVSEIFIPADPLGIFMIPFFDGGLAMALEVF